MGGNRTLEQRFGEAAYGVRWAAGIIKGVKEECGGRFSLGQGGSIVLKDAGPSIGDSFTASRAGKDIKVTSHTAVGTMGALLEVANRINAGRPADCARTLKFKSRNYKHEVNLDARGRAAVKTGKFEHNRRPVGPPPPLTKYSDRLMETLFQELVRRHFNGFVVYFGKHPFEYFLDYKGFEHATRRSASERRAMCAALRRFYTWAKRYGFRTFLHHYATHFTQTLADHLQLGVSEKSGNRAANIEHPIVEEYNRYIYRRTLELLPELDGYYVNFESSGNAVDFMQKTLISVAHSLERKPVLFFRLWGVSDVAGMTSLLRRYRGPKGLVHKSHDTSDFYFYPVADERVKIWKRALPEVEFAFSLGPCHNCGTNISRKLWTDPEYVHALLRDMEDKGADSISFQSSSELLLDILPGKSVFTKLQRDHARANRGHAEAVVDYVRGEDPAPRKWNERYAAWFGTTPKAGSAVREAVFQSSRIILLGYQQFCYGSAQEGQRYPGRFSHYQEPFFYYPMSFMNRFGEIRPNIRWRTWAVRDRIVKVVPGDTQAPIDSVNPAVKHRASRGPVTMIRLLKRHISAARSAARNYKRLAGPKADRALLREVEDNCLRGERLWREIAVARELGSCYFVSGRSEFIRHLERARDILLDALKALGPNVRATDSFCISNVNAHWHPESDAAAIDSAVRLARAGDYPDKALAAYLRSHERYNEIRRLNRPYISVRGAMMQRNVRLLRAALKHAERSLSYLAGSEKYAVHYENVRTWRDYLRSEIDGAKPPAMLCVPDNAIDRAEGFNEMVHDQNYRWGEPSIDDFTSFFRPLDLARKPHTQFRCTHSRTGLILSLREYDVDMAARRSTWNAKRGTVQQGEFMEIFIDAGNTGNRVHHYRFYYEGRGGTVGMYKELRNAGIELTRPAPISGCRARFEHTDTSWRLDALIPWKQLGGQPRDKAVWRVNILSNPGAERNGFSSWCRGYEFRYDTARLGKIIFQGQTEG